MEELEELETLMQTDLFRAWHDQPHLGYPAQQGNMQSQSSKKLNFRIQNCIDVNQEANCISYVD